MLRHLLLSRPQLRALVGSAHQRSYIHSPDVFGNKLQHGKRGESGRHKNGKSADHDRGDPNQVDGSIGHSGDGDILEPAFIANVHGGKGFLNFNVAQTLSLEAGGHGHEFDSFEAPTTNQEQRTSGGGRLLAAPSGSGKTSGDVIERLAGPGLDWLADSSIAIAMRMKTSYPFTQNFIAKANAVLKSGQYGSEDARQMMDVFAKAGHVKHTLNVLKHLQRRDPLSVRPEHIYYALAACAKRKQVKLAEDLFSEYVLRRRSSSGRSQSGHVGSETIRLSFITPRLVWAMQAVYAKAGRLEDVEELNHFLRDNHIEPHHFNASVEILACARAGMVEEARELFDAYLASSNGERHAKDAYVYMMQAYANAGRVRDAMALLNEMELKAPELDTRVFLCISKAHYVAGTPQDGFAFLASVIQDYGAAPPPKAFTTTMRGFAERGDIDGVKQTMVLCSNAGTPVDVSAYEFLIRAHMAAGDMLGAETIYERVFSQAACSSIENNLRTGEKQGQGKGRGQQQQQQQQQEEHREEAEGQRAFKPTFTLSKALVQQYLAEGNVPMAAHAMMRLLDCGYRADTFLSERQRHRLLAFTQQAILSSSALQPAQDTDANNDDDDRTPSPA